MWARNGREKVVTRVGWRVQRTGGAWGNGQRWVGGSRRTSKNIEEPRRTSKNLKEVRVRAVGTVGVVSAANMVSDVVCVATPNLLGAARRNPLHRVV